MKPLAKRAFTDKQTRVMDCIIARLGVVTPHDYQSISEASGCSIGYVSTIVNATNDTGRRINAEINRRLKYIPIADKERRVAYAKTFLDDQLERRMRDGAPLSDLDPLDILDYIRKEEGSQAHGTVDKRTQTVNVFDFGGYDDNKLDSLIERLQGAIDSKGDVTEIIIGEVVDAESARVIDAADVGGRDAGEDSQDIE